LEHEADAATDLTQRVVGELDATHAHAALVGTLPDLEVRRAPVASDWAFALALPALAGLARIAGALVGGFAA